MKITRIDVYQLSLPLLKPYRLSGGRLLCTEIDSTIVRIDTDEGISGWGEACPWGSTYLPAYGPGIRTGLDYLAPLIIGYDPIQLNVLNRHMDLMLQSHPYVKSAIDIACWDIQGKCMNRPVYDLFGGRTEEDVLVNSSISTADPQEMLDIIASFQEQGYSVHSCKVGDNNPQMDVRRIETIEANRLENEVYTYDANRAWVPATAIHVMKAVSTPLSWFEQPCETIEECAQVRNCTLQATVLDECLHKFSDLQRVVTNKQCDGVKIKPNRVGGLTKAKLMRDFCLENGIQMHIEDVGGTVLADTAAVHLAVSTPTSHRLATWVCQDMIKDELAAGQGARNRSGKIEVPVQPGFGIEPDLTLLGKPVQTYR